MRATKRRNCATCKYGRCFEQSTSFCIRMLYDKGGMSRQMIESLPPRIQADAVVCHAWKSKETTKEASK